MKKIVIGLVCAALAACTIPESITFKGKPGLKIPLGSPFQLSDVRIEDQISPDTIREMLSSVGTGNVKVYDYIGPDTDEGVQAYAVHYAIAEMRLDFSEEINNAIEGSKDGSGASSFTIPPEYANPNLPGISGTFPFFLTGDNKTLRPSASDPLNPPFLIQLGDMAKMVKEVDGEVFGLEIPYDASFAQNIKMRIPAFGIDNYELGEQVGEKLRFYNPDKKAFYPYKKSEAKNGNSGDLNDKNEVEIFIQVLGPCAGDIVPEPVFEWTKAIIDTSGQTLSNTYTITNELGNFFGDDVSLHEVKGYVYVHGVQEGTTMELKVGDKTVITKNDKMTERERPRLPDGDDWTTTDPFPPHSFGEPIDLKDAFGSSGLELFYDVDIPEWTIVNDPDHLEIVITADLIMLLPLELRVSTPTDARGYQNTHVKIDLGGALDDLGIDGDLFDELLNSGNGIASGNNQDGASDGLFKGLDFDIEWFEVKLTHYTNEIIDNDLSILVFADEGTTPLASIDLERDKAEITSGRIDKPDHFSPRFEILLKKEKPGDDYALLKIKRQTPGDTSTKFDFNLSISAKTNLEWPIDLAELSSGNE